MARDDHDGMGDGGGGERPRRRDRGRERDGDRRAEHEPTRDRAPVPGKATLTERLPPAHPGAVAERGVRGVVAAIDQIEALTPRLAAAIAEADYAASGRLALEVRLLSRRASAALARLADDPHAAALAESIAAAAERLAAAARSASPLVRVAPQLDAPGAGELAAEAAWKASAGADAHGSAEPPAMQPTAPSPSALARNVIAAGARGELAGDRFRAVAQHLPAEPAPAEVVATAPAPIEVSPPWAAAAARFTAATRVAAWRPVADALGVRLGLGPVELRADERARALADAHGARAVAHDNVVHLHPERATPDAPEAAEVLAHELVHLAQAQLPADADAGRDAAEAEAAELAPRLVQGHAVRPARRIDLSRPAADAHAAAPVRAVALDAGDGEKYLRVRLYEVVDRALAMLPYEPGTAETAAGISLDGPAFAHYLQRRMRAYVDAHRVPGLVALSHPADLLVLVASLVRGARHLMDPGLLARVGDLVGAQLSAAVVVAFARIAPRVMAAARKAGDAAWLSRADIPYDGHVDALVLDALLQPSIAVVHVDDRARARADRARESDAARVAGITAVELAALLDAMGARVQRAGELVGPWHETIGEPVRAWIDQQRYWVTGLPAGKLAALAPIVDAGSATVRAALDGIAALVARYPLPPDGPDVPTTRPIRAVLVDYVRAIDRAHAPGSGREELARASQAAKLVSLDLVALGLREGRDAAASVADAARASGSRTTRLANGPEFAAQARAAEQALEDQLRAQRQRVISGEDLDPEATAEIAVASGEQAIGNRLEALVLQSHTLLLVASQAKAKDAVSEMLYRVAGPVHRIEEKYRADQAEVATWRAGQASIDSTEDRRRRQACVDAARRALAALAADGAIEAAFERAHRQIENARVREAIVNLAILIGITLVTGQVAGLAAGLARGLMAAESAADLLLAERMGGLVAGLTEIGVDSVLTTGAQRLVLGGDGSVLGDLGQNLVASALLRPFAALARELGAVEAAAKPRWVQTGGRWVLQGAVAGMEIVASTAVTYLSERLRAGGGTASAEQQAAWLDQGLSMALGKLLSGRLASFEHRMRELAEDAGQSLRRQIAGVRRSAHEAAEHGSAPALLHAADGYRALLARETELLAGAAAAGRRVDPDARAAHAADVRDLGPERFATLRWKEQGLEPLAGDGGLWMGTPDQIERAIHAAGPDAAATVVREPDGRVRLRVAGQDVVLAPRGVDGGGGASGDHGSDHGGAGSGHGGVDPVLAAARRASLIAANMVGDARATGVDRYAVGPGDREVTVTVRTGDGDRPVTRRTRRDGSVELTLSRKLAPEAVEAVVTGELARVAHEARRRAAGYAEDVPDALGEHGEGHVLSANDAASLAELRVLRRQLRDATAAGAGGEAQRQRLEAEVATRERALGLVGDSEGAQRRRRLVEVQSIVEDDRARRVAATAAAAGPEGHAGIDLHDHFLGVVTVDVFRKRAAIARDGVDGGSWVPVLDELAGMTRYAHQTGAKGEITRRTASGDAYAIVEEAQEQVLRLLQRAKDEHAATDKDRAMWRDKAEQLAADAVHAALTATPETDFNSAYELRDELIKGTFAGPRTADGDPAARVQAGYEVYVREALLQLAASGVRYTEQSNSVKKLAERFAPETIQRVHAQLVAEGLLQPGQVDLRFLAMLPTSHFGARDRAGPEDEVAPRSTDAEFERAVDELIARIRRGDAVGADIAGLEQYLFDDLGKERLAYLYRRLAAEARRQGQPLVLRPHVGEGAVDPHAGRAWSRDAHPTAAGGEPTHYDRARTNLAQTLDALDAVVASGDFDATLVRVRFGHATHATPEEAARMAALGVTAEVNLGSNVRTGALDQTERRADGVPARVEQLDDHALPTFIYEGVPVVLATDGGSVMATDLAGEHRRAERIIEEVLAGQRPIRVRAADAGTRGTPVPGRPGERELVVTDLTAAELGRFLTAGERLHAEARAYHAVRPKPQATQAGAPTAPHWTDLARHSGLFATGGTRELSGARLDAERAATAMRARGDLVREEPLFDGGVVYHVTSPDGAASVDLVGWADAPADYLPDPDPADPHAPQTNPEIRAWYKAQVATIDALDRGWQAERLSLETRARRAYEIRERARNTARAMMPDRAQVVALEVRDTAVHGTPDPSFDLLVNRYMAEGKTRDEAYAAIIGAAQRTNTAYDRRNGIDEEGPAR